MEKLNLLGPISRPHRGAATNRACGIAKKKKLVESLNRSEPKKNPPPIVEMSRENRNLKMTVDQQWTEPAPMTYQLHETRVEERKLWIQTDVPIVVHRDAVGLLRAKKRLNLR